MAIQEKTRISQAAKKPRVAIMNAVHDLPVLVARDKGFFKEEGLDIEFVTTPGMAQVTTSHSVKFDSVFDRPLDHGHPGPLRELVCSLQQVDRPLAIAGAVSAEEHVSVIEARERERRAVTRLAR